MPLAGRTLVVRGRHLVARLIERARERAGQPSPLTFDEYATVWFSEGAARRGWKPATVLQYRSVRERLVDHFGPFPLAAIRPRHIAEYIAEMSETSGASLVGRDVDLLHAIFKTAVKEELVESNPATGSEPSMTSGTRRSRTTRLRERTRWR
jgi:Phage integrase central domain